MSVYPAESVRIAAESIGLSQLSDEVTQSLAGDIEFRVRELIQVGFSVSCAGGYQIYDSLQENKVDN